MAERCAFDPVTVTAIVEDAERRLVDMSEDHPDRWSLVMTRSMGQRALKRHQEQGQDPSARKVPTPAFILDLVAQHA